MRSDKDVTPPAQNHHVGHCGRHNLAVQWLDYAGGVNMRILFEETLAVVGT